MKRKENLTAAAQVKQRKRDLQLVDWIIANWTENISRGDKRAVLDFRRLLQTPPRDGANRFGVLTDNQRRLALVVARTVDREFNEAMIDELEDPAERNKHVPRGKSVPLPPVLQALPLKPPGYGSSVRVVK